MARHKDTSTVFGMRLREARLAANSPQDKLGVAIGLDESTASARISRYETGQHEPPYQTAQQLATVLRVPVAYLYCDDDRLAKLICQLADADGDQLLQVNRCLSGIRSL